MDQNVDNYLYHAWKLKCLNSVKAKLKVNLEKSNRPKELVRRPQVPSKLERCQRQHSPASITIRLPTKSITLHLNLQE